MFISEERCIAFVLELFMEIESASTTQDDHVTREVLPVHVPCQPEDPDSRQFTAEPRSDVRHTDGENRALDSSLDRCPAPSRCPEKMTLSRDHHLPSYHVPPPLTFVPDLFMASSNCGWSHYDSPPLPLNLFCLPFHPGYPNALPPIMPVPSQLEDCQGLLPVHNLLARCAMTSAAAAHLSPLLRAFCPSQPSALFPPPTNPRPQFTKLSETGVRCASDDGAAGMKERRMSCDSTATWEGMVKTTDLESTSSPRVVSSTSDDVDSDDRTAVHQSDVTGLSLSPRVVITAS